MKKLLTIAALAATASLSFGQGYVAFYNSSTTRISTNSVADSAGGSGSKVLVGGSAVPLFYYALLVAPTTVTTVDASYTGWAFSGSVGTNTTLPGRLNGSPLPTADGAQVNGYAPGTTANFCVVGWSANIGNTWAAAQAWWNNGNPLANEQLGVLYAFGTSGIATGIPVTALGTSYNAVFGSAASGLIPGFSLGSFQNVPEPSTFALAGLGAAALLIFRRRK